MHLQADAGRPIGVLAGPVVVAPGECLKPCEADVCVPRGHPDTLMRGMPHSQQLLLLVLQQAFPVSLECYPLARMWLGECNRPPASALKVRVLAVSGKFYLVKDTAKVGCNQRQIEMASMNVFS